MGAAIVKLAVYVGKKVAQIDPTDVLTQDNVHSVISLLKVFL